MTTKSYGFGLATFGGTLPGVAERQYILTVLEALAEAANASAMYGFASLAHRSF